MAPWQQPAKTARLLHAEHFTASADQYDTKFTGRISWTVYTPRHARQWQLTISTFIITLLVADQLALWESALPWVYVTFSLATQFKSFASGTNFTAVNEAKTTTDDKVHSYASNVHWYATKRLWDYLI